MKRLIPFLLVVLCSFGAAAQPNNSVTYFVQLVVGTNREKPPEGAKWNKIGPSLQRELSPVFRWSNYWEVNRQKAEVAPRSVSRLRLNEARELEIRISPDGQVELQLFRDGKVVRKMKDIVSNRRLIMGGDRNKEEAWFVIIRQDKPSNE
jgi:hypothetical protein